MVICERHRLVYLCPPKTGSVSLRHVLTGPEFGGIIPQEDVNAGHTTIWKEELRGYYFFITVRHPYRRMISLWRYGQHMTETFQKLSRRDRHAHRYRFHRWWNRTVRDPKLPLEKFLQIPHIRRNLQEHYYCSWHLRKIPIPIDRIVHLERFQEEIALVPGLEKTEFPRINRGPELDRPWYEYYTPPLIERVRRAWPMDFLPLGYNPDFREVAEGHIFAGDDHVQPCSSPKVSSVTVTDAADSALVAGNSDAAKEKTK